MGARVRHATTVALLGACMLLSAESARSVPPDAPPSQRFRLSAAELRTVDPDDDGRFALRGSLRQAAAKKSPDSRFSFTPSSDHDDDCAPHGERPPRIFRNGFEAT
jgi:hypothetical protein